MASTDVAVYIVSEDYKDRSNQDKKDDWYKNRSRCMYMYICCIVYIIIPICFLIQFAFGFYGLSICPAGCYGPFVLIAHAMICLIITLAMCRIGDRKYHKHSGMAQLIISIVGLMIYGFLIIFVLPHPMLESRNAEPLCYIGNALYFYSLYSIGPVSSVLVINILWKILYINRDYFTSMKGALVNNLEL